MTNKGISTWKAADLWRDQLYQLQSVIDTLLSGRETLKILDAGCGDEIHLRLPGHAYLVGIDISEEQLRKNTAMNEKIVGDIQTYELPRSEFDAIICWWVLEHLPQPHKALDNFLCAVKEDGIIILAVPNVLSLKGLVTKYTPHWFHVWFYKSVRGCKDHLPFPSFLKLSISPAAMRRFARKNNLIIAYYALYTLKEDSELINAGMWIMRQIIRLLTLGRVDPGLTELIIVLKKQKVSVSNAMTCAKGESVVHKESILSRLGTDPRKYGG